MNVVASNETDQQEDAYFAETESSDVEGKSRVLEDKCNETKIQKYL